MSNTKSRSCSGMPPQASWTETNASELSASSSPASTTMLPPRRRGAEGVVQQVAYHPGHLGGGQVDHRNRGPDRAPQLDLLGLARARATGEGVVDQLVERHPLVLQ